MWGQVFLKNIYYYLKKLIKFLIKNNNSEVQFSPKKCIYIFKFSNFKYHTNLNLKKLNRADMSGTRGLEIIVTWYMPWLFGKVPCTYIAHNLRFFDKYQCEYISSQVLTMHALV